MQRRGDKGSTRYGCSLDDQGQPRRLDWMRQALGAPANLGMDTAELPGLKALK